MFFFLDLCNMDMNLGSVPTLSLALIGKVSRPTRTHFYLRNCKEAMPNKHCVPLKPVSDC